MQICKKKVDLCNFLQNEFSNSENQPENMKKTDIQFLSRMSLNTCSTFARKGANLGQNLILREAFRFGRPPPPKRLKSKLLLSDYRQKFVNGIRNIFMLKLEFV